MPDEITVDPQVAPTPEDAERIGTLGNVFQEGEVQEIQVDPLSTPPPTPQPNGLVRIRVNEAVEDMSYVAGGQRLKFSAEAGQFIDVPVEVAVELEMLGRVWH